MECVRVITSGEIDRYEASKATPYVRFAGQADTETYVVDMREVEVVVDNVLLKITGPVRVYIKTLLEYLGIDLNKVSSIQKEAGEACLRVIIKTKSISE